MKMKKKVEMINDKFDEQKQYLQVKVSRIGNNIKVLATTQAHQFSSDPLYGDKVSMTRS